jgi:hypothetical protein
LQVDGILITGKQVKITQRPGQVQLTPKRFIIISAEHSIFKYRIKIKPRVNLKVSLLGNWSLSQFRVKEMYLLIKIFLLINDLLLFNFS